MDNKLGLEFITCFNHMTERTADQNVPWLLHVDCHGLHITLELLSYARDHNIIIMIYVLHSTHLCQGLNVAVFGVHKVHWAQECEKFERESGRTIRKEDFLLVHARAIQRTFKKETILSAWEKTGLRPFNPDIITPDMVAPSTAMSTHTLQLFPVAQPTPVRRVVQCMYQWMHADQPLPPPPPAVQLPLERGPDSAIDPALANPPPENSSVDGLMASLQDTLWNSSQTFQVSPLVTSYPHFKHLLALRTPSLRR